MTKSNRHKKQRKADFVKTRLKLGQQKTTQLSFSVKSIALQKQSLSDATLDSASKLRDLLTRLGHYSVQTRSQALSQTLSLISNAPEIIPAHFSNLISALARLISDSSQQIRNQALDLLDILNPPPQTLLFFILAALSSLDQSISRDSLTFLDRLLLQSADTITDGWPSSPESLGHKIIDALLTSLRVRSLGQAQGSYTFAANGDALPPATRLAVLKSLALFLNLALAPEAGGSDAEPWYLQSSFASLRGYHSFLSTLSSATPTAAPSLYYETSLPISSILYTQEEAETISIPSLISLLHSTLVSAFLDSAPQVFDPSVTEPEGKHLEAILSVMRISSALFWDCLGGTHQNDGENNSQSADILAHLIGQMAPHFPFGESLLETTSRLEDDFLNLNLTFSSLVSLLVLTVQGGTKLSAGKGKNHLTKSKLDKLNESVSSWVVKLLSGKLTTQSRPLGVSISEDLYTTLEPTLWAILNQTEREDDSMDVEELDGPNQVVEAIVNHFIKSPSASTVKKQAFSFISRILMIDSAPSYQARFRCEATDVTNDFVLHLPRYLWELGSKHPDTTHDVLIFLTRLFARYSDGKYSKSLASVVPTLLPFFSYTHPKKGVQSGPFSKLPSHVQSAGASLVWFVLSADVAQKDAFRDAVTKGCQSVITKEQGGGIWSAILQQ